MLLQKRYRESNLDFLESKGMVVLRTSYRIDLANFYQMNKVKIDERIMVDPKTMVPWFAYFCYSNLPQEKRSRVLEAIEEAYEKTDGIVFGNSSDSATIKVNVLAKHGKPDEKLIGEAIEHLKKLEKIIQND